MQKKSVKEIDQEELEQLYSMVEDEISIMNRRLGKESIKSTIIVPSKT